jgi:hypothetical protein
MNYFQLTAMRSLDFYGQFEQFSCDNLRRCPQLFHYGGKMVSKDRRKNG